MKKSILIISALLTVISLTAFGYKSLNHTETAPEKTRCSKIAVPYDYFVNKTDLYVKPDLYYGVDSRFIANVTKENLHNATSIVDILPKEATESITSYQNVSVQVLADNTIEIGNEAVLNTSQKQLLQTIDYSTNIRVNADCMRENDDVGVPTYYDLVYYITVIPENEAEFADGHDALIEYLKENSKEETAIIERDQLRPGKVSFVVTKEGKIANVQLDSTSGYTSVDEALIELVTHMPGKWNPATNSNGEKVDQELIFFFGLQGC